MMFIMMTKLWASVVGPTESSQKVDWDTTVSSSKSEMCLSNPKERHTPPSLLIGKII